MAILLSVRICRISIHATLSVVGTDLHLLISQSSPHSMKLLTAKYFHNIGLKTQIYISEFSIM